MIIHYDVTQRGKTAGLTLFHLLYIPLKKNA